MAAPYILGIDYGDKRVGVAIAHTVARLPRPLTTLANTPQLIDDIGRLVQQEEAGAVVVGLPRGMDGGYSEQTRAAEAFQQRLAAALPVPVSLTDETLTSVDAEAVLGRKGSYDKADVDALAATYILERFFADNPVAEGRA